MTQQNEILNHLQTHKTPLTSAVAFTKYGCTRLGGVIFNLKKKGHNIKTVKKTVLTKYGKTVIAGYVMGGEDGSDNTDTGTIKRNK